MNTATRSYLETAIWADLDEEYELDIDDVALESVERAAADTDRFIEAAGADAMDEGRLMHDFWLTRNRHGAGFWDGDWPEPQATRLTDLAHEFGECYLYVGDDGHIYLQ